MNRVLTRLLIFAAIVACAAAVRAADDPLAWPQVTAESRPWARWWWLGSAVDEANLTRLLEQYRGAGIGGVEICPIYGAKGYEDRYLDFLSPKWMAMLAHTTREAKRLGMGVDLTTGTGWPFGGPGVSSEHASARLVLKRYELNGGGTLTESLPAGKLQCLRAVGDDDKQVDLTSQVTDGRLNWTAPTGHWRLYAIASASPIQKVKRAAPGGEGNVLDPYSPAAMASYLGAFDRAFAGFDAPMPRSQFHDSFEYYSATWTSDFLDEFQRRRGYDLRRQLPALFGDGDADTVARVKCDYRETIADLHLAYVARWADWSHAHGSLARNQAHGAPANLLDLYAAADIPETELFGLPDERSVPLHKFASSAAHLSGRNLASSESFTWAGEHFQVPLAQLKPAADFLFLGGVNHIIFHGIPYSPADAPWPGWLFYASVNFGPNGGLWHDLPAFNAYLARCQSILQSGRPDNDVLLYWPVYDTWQSPGGLLIPFTVHDQPKWLWPSAFHAAAMQLEKRGYSYDAVSDRPLAGAKCIDGRVQLGAGSYRVIVVPKTRLMPVATMRKLIELAAAGANVIVQGTLPNDVPGFGDLQRRRDELLIAKEAIKPISARFIVGLDRDLEALLTQVGVSREQMVDDGLKFIRRSRGDGADYFIVNPSVQRFEGWTPLATPIKSAAILDPLLGNRAGVAAVRDDNDVYLQVYLQLPPGGSCVVRTFRDRDLNDAPRWGCFHAGEPTAVEGNWQVHFIEGGPALPEDFETDRLASWTTRDDAEAKRFAGTARYRIEFDAPRQAADDWLLDLGRVCESARVRLNGHDVATLWCEPFQVRVGELLKPGRNTLEIDVTNLAANRIADLDRRGVNWKAFHEINFVNKDYRPFDASHWPLRNSGLLGPVRLIPLKRFDPTTER
jgi:hypothetical protein